MLTVTPENSLSDGVLHLLLYFLGVEIVNRMKSEQLDVAVRQRHSAKMTTTNHLQQY